MVTTNSKNGGYGVMSNAIKRMFKSFGWEVTKRSDADIVFSYGMPDTLDRVAELYKGKKKPFHIAYVVWESSEFPIEWTEKYKSANINLLLTASSYIQEVMENAGLYPQVWHHGVDARFKFKERPDDGVFTFYHYNSFEFRKGWETALVAMTNEFHVEEKVKLVLKGRELSEARWIIPESVTDIENFKLHPLVEVVTGHVSDEEMVRLSDTADCFVFPAKGEGWGLPPCEMMAVGCPAIIPNAHSFTEFFDEDDCLEVELAGYLNAEPRYRGYLIQPSVSDLQRKMRWAFQNQDKIRKMGRKASERMHKYFNWKKIGRDFLSLLDNAFSKDDN